MSTTIQFSDATYEDGFAVVQFSVDYFTQESPNGLTIGAKTTVVEPRPDRVAFITTIDPETAKSTGLPRIIAETTLDPNEEESSYPLIMAEVMGFHAQTLMLPGDDPQVALAVAHQVISGARYDWG